jgi:hypothetical protein
MFPLPNVAENRKLDPRMRSELSDWLAQSLNTRHQLAVALGQDPACLELTNLDIPRSSSPRQRLALLRVRANTEQDSICMDPLTDREDRELSLVS